MPNPKADTAKATEEDKKAAEELSAQWVVERLMAIASADFSQLIETDAFGYPSVNLELLTDDMRMAIQEITTTSYKGNKKITIKPADRLKALDMLGKYLAMFKDSVKVEGELTLVERLQSGRARMNQEQEDLMKKSQGNIRLKSEKEG